jgi:hypothetical protein
MSEKGSSFRSLFFKDKSEPQQEQEQAQPQKQSIAIKKSNNNVSGGGLLTPIKSYSVPDTVIVADNNLIEAFVQKLQDLINQSNQSGFDFLEFTETLFEESQTPDSDNFKLVFRIAKKMDNSLTVEKLIQSANYYKNIINQSADGEISKGQSKKNSLQNEKENERKVLEKIQNDANSQIEQLNRQISDLQTKANNALNQLNEIDQKYYNQFVDIDTKISAISEAKQQVLNSITDIETGITNNLK